MSLLVEIGIGRLKGKIDTPIGKAKEKVAYAVESTKWQAKAQHRRRRGRRIPPFPENWIRLERPSTKGTQKL
jgi:hypothetical protein